MGESVSFAFSRNEKVQVKEAPHIVGKVVSQIVARSGVRSYCVQHISATDGTQALPWWDEDELEKAAATPALAPSTKDAVKAAVEEHVATVIPAITTAVQAGVQAASDHPDAAKAVQDASAGKPGSAPSTVAAIAKTIVENPTVQKIAGDAAKSALAAVLPSTKS